MVDSWSMFILKNPGSWCETSKNFGKHASYHIRKNKLAPYLKELDKSFQRAIPSRKAVGYYQSIIQLMNFSCLVTLYKEIVILLHFPSLTELHHNLFSWYVRTWVVYTGVQLIQELQHSPLSGGVPSRLEALNIS